MTWTCAQKKTIQGGFLGFFELRVYCCLGIPRSGKHPRIDSILHLPSCPNKIWGGGWLGRVYMKGMGLDVGFVSLHAWCTTSTSDHVKSTKITNGIQFWYILKIQDVQLLKLIEHLFMTSCCSWSPWFTYFLNNHDPKLRISKKRIFHFERRNLTGSDLGKFWKKFVFPKIGAPPNHPF